MYCNHVNEGPCGYCDSEPEVSDAIAAERARRIEAEALIERLMTAFAEHDKCGDEEKDDTANAAVAEYRAKYEVNQ